MALLSSFLQWYLACVGDCVHDLTIWCWSAQRSKSAFIGCLSTEFSLYISSHLVNKEGIVSPCCRMSVLTATESNLWLLELFRALPQVFWYCTLWFCCVMQKSAALTSGVLFAMQLSLQMSSVHPACSHCFPGGLSFCWAHQVWQGNKLAPCLLLSIHGSFWVLVLGFIGFVTKL